MQWLRKLVSSSANAPKAARPSAFRPNLETMEAREVPSVSSVLTATGVTQFIVDNTNSLIVKSTVFGTATVIQGSNGTTPTGVRTAQGFRTQAGTLGFDAVMLDGTLRHFEQSGTTLLPTGNYTAADFGFAGRKILDVGTAYDTQGRLRFDLLLTKAGNTSVALNQVGDLFEFNQANGGGLTNTGLPNVRWVSTYLDPNGGTGIAVGQTFGTELLVRKADAVAGLSVLYDGSNSATAAITEYSQTVTPILNVGNLPGVPNNTLNTTTNAALRRVVVDITYNGDTSFGAATNGGTYATEFSVTPSANLAPAISVTGVGVGASPDNTIKAGG